MIPFHFAYARPETSEEAVALWTECHAVGKTPIYYSGGTEIITLCRDMKIKPDLVIDLKSIGACNGFEQKRIITYGAALRLNTIAEKTKSGLLARCVSAIADQTTRNQITLGGNILGQLPYREALLAFLVLGGTATVAGEKGIREIPLMPYSKRIQLESGEFITRFSLDPERVKDPFVYVRKTKGSPVDYPILTACFSGRPGRVALAVSGAFSSPVRDGNTEAILNQTDLGITKRSENAVQELASFFKTDFRASAEYRRHLLKRAIQKALTEFED